MVLSGLITGAVSIHLVALELLKKRFEDAGLPTLILDGDGCDRSHGGEGQTSTRLGAFLEMLGDFAHE